MRFFVKCVFFLFTAFSVFPQSKAVPGAGNGRDQGLLTSEPFWRQALGGSVLSLPDVQAQSAVVALDGGNIRAYSTAGTPMWDYSARGRINPFVTRSREGTSYFSRTNGTLIAINRAGRELWRRNPGNPLCANVIPGWDGRLFVPTEKKISCYTAAGTLLWSRTFDSPFAIAPKRDNSGGIIFTLENNELYRLDPFGNFQKWELSNKPAVLLSDTQGQTAAQGRIMALYANGNIEIAGQPYGWYISDKNDKSHEPVPLLPSGVLAAVYRGGNLAAVFSDGSIALVSLDDKKILWKGDSHIREFIKSGGRAEQEVEMLFDDRGIYVLSKNGASGFAHDGRRLWYTLLQNAAAIPAFGDDGVLYSGGKDWILYAYKIEDRIQPDVANIYGPASEGFYGTGAPNPQYIPNIPYFDYEIKEKLEKIESAIKTGNVGSNELSYTTFLMTVSTGEFIIQDKIKAIEYLGQIGSHETIPWLVNIFKRENDPSLRSAAAGAIGAIGVDPQGTAIQMFFNSIIQGGGTAIKDDQILASIVSATGALCRFSGPPLSETGTRILNMLSGKTHSAKINRQAKKELDTLK